MDGGARGNPGPAAVAAVASTPDGEELAERKLYIGEATNNVAEYYRDDPHVEVIIDRRAQGGKPGDHEAFEDRRRQRPKGSFPTIEPPA